MNLDSANELAPVLFADSYLEARKEFLAAAPHAKAYPCSTPGPSGEALFTDAAWFGLRDARKVLVLISATPCGSRMCGSIRRRSRRASRAIRTGRSRRCMCFSSVPLTTF